MHHFIFESPQAHLKLLILSISYPDLLCCVQLRSLNISGHPENFSKVSDLGLQILSHGLVYLEDFEFLEATKITEEGLSELLNSCPLRRLVTSGDFFVCVVGCNFVRDFYVTKCGEQRLSALLTSCVVGWVGGWVCARVHSSVRVCVHVCVRVRVGA